MRAPFSTRLAAGAGVLLLSGAASVLALASNAQGAPSSACAARSKGPCLFVDTSELVFPPRSSATPQDEPVLITNFGLVAATGDGVGAPPPRALVCEEAVGAGIPISTRSRLDSRGRLWVPWAQGLARGEPLSSPSASCTWSQLPSFRQTPVWDVAIVPAAEGRPDELWVLAGASVRTLYASYDDGATFDARQTFASTLRLLRVAVAPSDPAVMYLSGFTSTAGLVLARSSDAGKTFDVIDPAGGFDARWVEFLGVDPFDADTVYMARMSGALDTGDELWRSRDGGRTATRVLTLARGHEKRGFAFGDGPGTLYLAAVAPVPTDGSSGAWLHTSRDRGETWEAPLASSAQGPRFRCLHARAGALWACGAGPDEKDAALVVRSVDGGRTWQPQLALAEVRPPASCIAATCAATARWLCDAYGLCTQQADGGLVPGDAAPSDAGNATPRGGGCACEHGARPRGSNGGLVPTMLTLTLIHRLLGLCTRARARRRSRGKWSR